MTRMHKKLAVDEHGKRMEVIIPWEECKEMEKLLGLNLDEEVISDLKQAQNDRTNGKKEAYLDLDSI